MNMKNPFGISKQLKVLHVAVHIVFYRMLLTFWSFQNF